MSLTVLNVAYSLATLGPAAVGGAEQVLQTIDRALVAAGATSITVACAGSSVAGLHVQTPAVDPPFDELAQARARRAHADAIARTIDRHRVDIAHLHGVDFADYLPEAGVPVVATLHLPPAWYSTAALAPRRPRTFLNCVSRAQRNACPPSAMIAATIENGVAVPESPARSRAPRFALAMGRICPEKGFHHALDAVKRARVPFVLAGCCFPYAAHEQYFATDIVPRLDRSRRFVGPVGPEEKLALLSSARCVLIPSLVPETSSLVAMEAMAAGVPVIAFPNGALSEIVQHGVTGFLVNDAAEMADAISAVDTLRSDACHEAARTRFDASRMTRDYIRLYEQILKDEDRREA